jgi:hypothetical protein
MVDGWPQGYCTQISCSAGSCPSGSDCDVNGMCIDICNPSASPSECRSGYICNTAFNQLEQPFWGCLPGG